MPCISCRIVSGEIASEIVHQDNEVIVFRDLNPQAPTHILIVPKKHIPSLFDLGEEEMELTPSWQAQARR